MPPTRSIPPPLRVLTLALVAWAAYAAARTAVRVLLPASDMAGTLEQDLVSTVFAVGCWAFCLWLGRLRYPREVFWNLPRRQGLAWGLGAWLSAAFALSYIAQPFAAFNAWNAGARALETAVALALAASEEVGWRATVFEPLREALGGGWALGLSTLGSTLIAVGVQPWQSLPRVALLGLALGLARLRGMSLGALIAIHFACGAGLALYQPEGPAQGWVPDALSAGLIAAAVAALYFVKPRAVGA